MLVTRVAARSSNSDSILGGTVPSSDRHNAGKAMDLRVEQTRRVRMIEGDR